MAFENLKGWWAERKKRKEEEKASKPASAGEVKVAKAAPKVAHKKEAPAAAPAVCAADSEPVGLAAADLGPLLPGAPPNGKINLAIYWAAACGGCDVSILDSNERILTIGDMANIVMWPIAIDGKEKDIAAMEDGSITVAMINGAIRNSENEHMAKLLRQKSLIVVSYGTCACFGGSPALANLVPGGKDEILDYVYTKTKSSATFQEANHKNKPSIPKTSTKVPEGELTLPVLYDTVYALDQVIDVDYYIPGCPPLQESISHLLKAVVDFAYHGVALPPKGTVVGVTSKTLCEECPREKSFARITEVKEPYQVDTNNNKCLMDQGILCLGPSTMGGCGARCTKAGQPCRGCYGASPTFRNRERAYSLRLRRCSPSPTRTRLWAKTELPKS